jgi:hypothetical protein
VDHSLQAAEGTFDFERAGADASKREPKCLWTFARDVVISMYKDAVTAD